MIARLVLAILLLATPALAQTPGSFVGTSTNPNAPPLSAAALNAAFATKADAATAATSGSVAAEVTRALLAEGVNATAITNEAATARNASNLTSGIIPAARLPVVAITGGTITGTAIDSVTTEAATARNATNLTSGAIPAARLTGVDTTAALVTPTGGTQQTLGAAIASAAGCTTNCTFGGNTTITGGTISGTNSSGENVTAVGASNSQTNAARTAQVVDVRDYGALCNNVHDDTANIQAAINQVRSIIGLAGAAAVELRFPTSIPGATQALSFARCIVKSTLDFTHIIGAQVLVNGNHTEIYAQMAGSPAIDALGSNTITWKDFYVISDNTNVPTYGIQFGRTLPTASDYGGGAGMRFENIVISGYFSVAACYNFAGEEVIWIKPRCANSNNSATSYAYVEDGYNHFNITSAFVTQTNSVDVAQSFDANTVINASFVSQGASVVSAMWIGGVRQHEFINGYALNSAGSACITIYSEASGDNQILKLDVHCEGTSLATSLLISGTQAAVNIHDLSLFDGFMFASTNIFAVGGSVTSVMLENPDIHIAGGPGSPTFTVFDTANKYSTKGGKFYLYNNTPWNYPALFSSQVITPSVVQSNNFQTCTSVGPIIANNYGSSIFCTTTMRLQTSAAAQVFFTTDQSGTLSTTNCDNLPVNAIRSMSVRVAAWDRTTTSTSITWPDWVMSADQRTTASTLRVATGTKPTPFSNGTVTGTDISAVADTTNGCVKIGWTPPTSNAELWDVSAVTSWLQTR